MILFTLECRVWYAMEFTFPNGARHYSPIYCRGVRTKRSGKGWMDLSFWHGAYAEGVKDKTYSLRVLERAPGYLLASREFNKSSAAVLITALTEEWMCVHFCHVLEGKPSRVSIPTWLDRQYPGVADIAVGLQSGRHSP